ncbi:hypothetical protein [Acetobacterium sp. K1/6]|uniref:hypothetical protein n=1 Tax=Acetobacterium sp. K1/6 TaxID=3055467 RepID=UPI002ACA82F7|nr:hypothetical protein [Acetobacterium sp. K1/6]MDZ5726407.1 hypothetical protein [Acetobacterium sp. K1/6]
MKNVKRNRLIMAVGVLIFIALTTTAFKTNDYTEQLGVEYRGHVQNKGDFPKPQGSYIPGPEALGTRGEGLRIEGLWINLTGDVPKNAGITYQVHVQNEGWMTPVKTNEFAGTEGLGQRIESIKIDLVNLPDFDVYYRGHVQDKGNIPVVNANQWGWVKNGDELGTTGSSLRLEEIQIKIVKKNDDGVVFDQPGVYDHKTGHEKIQGDAIVKSKDVILKNVSIDGDLIIDKAVGEGDVTLDNVTVSGETHIRGGGHDSIHLNGGSYNKFTIEKTANNIGIEANAVNDLEILISKDSNDNTFTFEGAFKLITVEAAKATVNIKDNTTVESILVNKNARDCKMYLSHNAEINQAVLNANAVIAGEGNIINAEIKADDIILVKEPQNMSVDPNIKEPQIDPDYGSSAQETKETIIKLTSSAEASIVFTIYDLVNGRDQVTIPSLTINDFELKKDNIANKDTVNDLVLEKVDANTYMIRYSEWINSFEPGRYNLSFNKEGYAKKSVDFEIARFDFKYVLKSMLNQIMYVPVSKDGSDISINDRWTTQEAKTAMEEAEQTAKKVLADGNVSEDAVMETTTATQTAINNYNNAKQKGLKGLSDKEKVANDVLFLQMNHYFIPIEYKTSMETRISYLQQRIDQLIQENINGIDTYNGSNVLVGFDENFGYFIKVTYGSYTSELKNITVKEEY